MVTGGKCNMKDISAAIVWKNLAITQRVATPFPHLSTEFRQFSSSQ